MKKVNVEQQAKRKKRSRSKHAAYMRSATRRVVEARAKGQCERTTRYETTYRCSCGYPRRAVQFVRCHETENLQHHHLTYARYGGKELPSDVLLVCKRCHEALESAHPTRKANRVRSGFSSEDSAE